MKDVHDRPQHPLRRLVADGEWLTYGRYLLRHKPHRLLLAPPAIVRGILRSRMQPPPGAPYETLATIDIPAAVEPGEIDTRVDLNAADAIVAGRIPLFSGRRNVPEAQTEFVDPEDFFYVNRWYHGVTLAKAFAATANVEYARTFVAMFERWLRAHSVPEGAAWESYSVSERIANWLRADQLLRSGAEYSAWRPLLLRTLEAHAAYLIDHLETAVIHNHLINNARALFLYGVLARVQRYADIGWTILREQLRRQVSPAGFLREQSSHYHLLVLSRYAEAFGVAEANGIEVPSEDLELVERMRSAALKFVRPDGTLVLIGDVSPDATPEDVVNRLGRHPEPRGEVAAIDGNVIYSSPETHLVVRCDGDVARHGHDDLLSFDLWSRGRSIVADTGNATFLTNAMGIHFRSAAAHSTITVDGKPPAIRSHTIRDLTRPDYPPFTSVLERVEPVAGGMRMAASHTLYGRLGGGIVVRREIALSGERRLHVRDTVEGQGHRRVEIALQFGRDVAAVDEGLRLLDATGTELAQIEVRSASNVRIVRREGLSSPAYGEAVPIRSLYCSLAGPLPLSVETIIDLK